jgi:hypothetical protein
VGVAGRGEGRAGGVHQPSEVHEHIVIGTVRSLRSLSFRTYVSVSRVPHRYAYGRLKVFIQDPRSLWKLEENRRLKQIQLATKLQVSAWV